MNDAVIHNDKTYSLADLAHYMEYEQREAVHFSDAVPGTSQEFWDEFVSRFPEEADHLASITPTIREVDETV